ncbi:hypothetical protein GCM10023083_56620 [Streptomyces phyllanthi]
MRATIEIPSGIDLDTVIEAVRELISRHQTLRTRFYVDENGTPRQATAGHGNLRLEVYETDGTELSEFTRRVSDSISETPFTPPEISVRPAIVTQGGTPSRAVLSIFHMAIDSWGLNRLAKDFEQVLQALASKADLPPRDILTHPSERVDFERTSAGMGRSAASVRYWEEQLGLFARDCAPEARNAPEHPQFREVWINSQALSVASRAVAHTLGVSVNAVFTGLAAHLLSERTGHPGVGFLVFNHNRYGRKWAAMYGTLTQNFPLYVAVDGRPLVDVIRTVHPLISKGIFYGQYDPDDLASAMAELSERRGFMPDISCAVNIMAEASDAAGDLSGDPAEPARAAQEALPATKVYQGAGLEHEDMNFYLSVSSRTGDTTAYLRANTKMFSSGDIEAFLRSMEQSLVDVLVRPDR